MADTKNSGSRDGPAIESRTAEKMHLASGLLLLVHHPGKFFRQYALQLLDLGQRLLLLFEILAQELLSVFVTEELCLVDHAAIRRDLVVFGFGYSAGDHRIE